MLITRDQPTSAGTFRKGHAITAADLPPLSSSDQRIHAVRLEADDVPEAVAVPRIAEAIAGAHIALQPMVQGRINLRSTCRGLLQIDTDALLELNRTAEIGVFTHHTDIAVEASAIVAGVKIAPVAMPRPVLEDALADIQSPIIDVLPFRRLRVSCLVTEHLQGRVRDRFEHTLREKIAWYGGTLERIVWLPEEQDEIAAAMQTEMDAVDLLLTAGSHMMDPLDPVLHALETAGATMIRLGAPAHPGSMVWAAQHQPTDTPILSLASCSMFSRSTVADLLLPIVFAGQRLTNETFARLGHDGLLDRGMDWRFPLYTSVE